MCSTETGVCPNASRDSNFSFPLLGLPGLRPHFHPGSSPSNDHYIYGNSFTGYAVFDHHSGFTGHSQRPALDET